MCLYVYILYCVVMIITQVHLALGQKQYFRIQPRDVQVHEGGEVMLECEVSNLAGKVQWTKDGFALGFSSTIPGFPRYSVIGDSRHGVYNLKIINASLDDDAEFQCQVGPSGIHKPIRANGRLTVISPPSSIEIVGHAPNSKIEIRENQEFQLECLVKNSKPAAKIVWYRGNVELKLDKRVDTTSEVDVSGKVKRYNVLSRIKLQPTAEDDYAEYVCEARHEALPPDMPLRVTVQLSVLYPPGIPYIEGYTEGEKIRRGQTLELVCRSRGGNPPAQLIWYKNNEQSSMVYRTAGRLSENTLTFTAEASDNKARYRCEANNVMSPAPLKTEVELTVLFAPAQVSITGPTEARMNETVFLTCTTANSNPPAEIKWMVGGRHVRNATSRTVVSPDGGWITTSNITANVGHNKRSLVVICHGINMQLTENVVSTHTINVLYPPGEPIIQGYTEGTILAAGTVQKISCVSSGGNPLATLTWYKNDKKINSVTKINDRSVSAEITILTNVSDNGARYKCEASNSATEIPRFANVILNVQFPPDHVLIRKTPSELKPGKQAVLTCDSSSSNPEAILSWWRQGIAVPGISNGSRAGLHGGRVSSISMTLDITPDMNGVKYECQAMNEALQISVHDAIILEVLYKPIFDNIPSEVMTGVEGEPFVLTLQATANPSNIMYTWTKDGSVLNKNHESRMITESSTLNITKLLRDDAGTYMCEAVNNEGSTAVKINLSVEYPPSVREAPEFVMINPGDDAQLHCVIDANPLKEEHIKWKKRGFQMGQRTEQSFYNNTAVLIVKQPTREDNGLFQCIVNNGIGKETKKAVHLVVKYKPEIDTSPQISRAASNTGDTARLTCRASGAPKLQFIWSREGGTIPVNTTEKYYIESNQIDIVTYESVLQIRTVRPSDYGGYECVVRNEMGFATTTVRLDVTSAPDTPVGLTVLNATHDSVTLAWKPGFDGGMESSYRIRYRPAADLTQGYRYVDVLSPDTTTYVVSGLSMATEYSFSIMSFNKLGTSNYLPDTLRHKTLSEVPPSFHSPSQDVDKSSGEGRMSGFVIVLMSVVGLALLLLNILLVGCCLHRRANKRLTATSEQSSSKSATIEMYAPSSYNETVTGETLSSVSEKSETYSNGDSNQDYAKDNTKPAASTYLIDQIEYPYPYPTYEIQHQPNPHHEEPDGASRNAYNPVIEGPKVHYATLPPPHHLDGPYYNISPDARYIAYPPQIEYTHIPQQPLNTGSLRRPQHRGNIVPPDVTVSHNPPLQNGPPAPLLSTFNPGLSYPSVLETEGHLV